MIAIPDVFSDGTLLVDLRAAVQAAWMAGSHATVVSLLKTYGLFDWLCPCCAGVRDTKFTSANAAHRDAPLVRLCASCIGLRKGFR